MPEQYTQSVKARDLRKGDEITGQLESHIVESAVVKQKFVHVTMTNDLDKIGYFEKDQPFTVIRTRLTADEQRHDETMRSLDAVDREEQIDRRRLVKARTRMVDLMASEKQMSWHELEDLAEAQELVLIWNAVRNTHLARNRMISSGEENVWNSFARHLTDDEIEEMGPCSRIEALTATQNNLRKQVLRDVSQINRSSSEASNLMDTYKLMMRAKWLEERDWDINLIDGSTHW